MVTRSAGSSSGRARLTALAALLLMLLGALTLAPAAQAQAPFNLPSQVTDEAGVLSSTSDVTAAFDRLRADTGVRMFVVYVDSFDGTSPESWTLQTFEKSGMGSSNLLLAVAVQDRAYQLYAPAGSALTDAQLDDVDVAVGNKLSEDDWSGAAVAGADTVRSALTGGSGGGFGVVLVGGLVVIVLVGVVMWAAGRKRRSAGNPAEGELSTLSTADLNRRASAALVSVDDELKSAEQELGFAQAQFGDEATDAFATTLAASKTKVTRAFTLRQQLDDENPETEPQARVMLAEIITLCDDVSRALAADAAQFADLRNLQETVPDVLAQTRGRVATTAARLDPARAAVAQLALTYPAISLASITANPDQAAQLLRAAEDSITSGEASVSSGDRATAVAHSRAAAQALAQAGTLLDAVDTAGTDLAQAWPRLDAAVVSIESDLADAARVGSSDAAVVAAASRAREVVAQAQAARQGGDPLAAIRAVTEAEAALDAALAPSRELAEQQARAAALLRDTLGRVDSQIRAVRDFVDTRKGAVGPEARTRLSEALRLYDEARAQAATDPVAALETTRRCEQLVQSAQQLAQADVQRWENQQRGPGNGGGGSNVGGMILGGILIDSILRGGGGNRGGGGFGGGGFGGGGGRGGGFGGGGGGGGGGGRSRGGRF